MSILRVRDKNGKVTDIPALAGKSAYQSALDNGFIGTEKDWINSLHASQPVFVKSEEDMKDKNKIYVYDGYIWTFQKSLKEIEVFKPGTATFVPDRRVSTTFQDIIKSEAGESTIIIPVDYTESPKEITIKFNKEINQVRSVMGGPWLETDVEYDTSKPFKGSTGCTYPDENTLNLSEEITDIVLNTNKYKYIGITLIGGEELFSELKVTYNNKPINLIKINITDDDTTVKAFDSIIPPKITTETVITDNFVNTDVAFAPADYEGRIKTLENKIETNSSMLIKSINNTHSPKQLPANGDNNSDFNLYTFSDFGKSFHNYFDDLLVKYPHYLTREYLGKDSSKTIDMYRYTAGKHYWTAWYKKNYPRMYAWKNNSVVIYSLSISPRLNDVMYSTPYIGTTYGTVTAISATNRSRTINGFEFIRDESNDIEPMVLYTSPYDNDNKDNQIKNINGNIVSKVASINGNKMKDNQDNTFFRYPFGDLNKNKKPLIHMTIITNEHGGKSEPGLPSVVAARFIRDLCEGQQSNNSIYKFLKDNIQITFVTPVNPWGCNFFPNKETNAGYTNSNWVNINRNYDTPGWDKMKAEDLAGAFPGSENETQYVMNTIADSKAVVAMSIHTLACNNIGPLNKLCKYQGQNPDGEYKLEKINLIADDMNSSYNLSFIAYDPLECPPEFTSKSPSYITQSGAYGGIIEFQVHNGLATEEQQKDLLTAFSSEVMEQNYSLLLKFIGMWLSDYLEVFDYDDKIYCRIDSNNNIIISGNIINENYTVKYEMNDGTYLDIGKLELDQGTYYSVTNNLTNCTTNNEATKILRGSSYNATLTAKSGYEISSIVVTMNGLEVEDYVVGNTINIPYVIGNIVITAIFKQNTVSEYTNLANPNSEDWINGKRYSVSSQGASDEDTKHIITNYIECKKGDILRVKGINILGTTQNNTSYGAKIIYFNENKEQIVGFYGTNVQGKSKWTYADKVVVTDNDVSVYTIPANDINYEQTDELQDFSYIRIDGILPEELTDENKEELLNNIVITINEEIEYTK